MTPDQHFALLRLEAIIGAILWGIATAVITREYILSWVDDVRVNHRMPLFLTGTIVMGVGYLIKTSFTLYAIYHEELTWWALHMLLIWPIIHAFAFLAIGYAVLHRRV